MLFIIGRKTETPKLKDILPRCEAESRNIGKLKLYHYNIYYLDEGVSSINNVVEYGC